MNTLNESLSPLADASDTPGQDFNQLEFFLLESDSSCFTSVRGFRKTVYLHRTALLQNKTSKQFLVFTEVPLSNFYTLSSDDESRQRRLYYNVLTKTLIVKVLPHQAHEVAIRDFDKLVGREITRLGLDDEVIPLGSATTTVGNWKKEADSNWVSITEHHNPKLVLEVGLSQSQRQLDLVSRGWLESSDSSVQIVISIAIYRDVPKIQINRWELVPNPNYSRATHSLSLIYSRTATKQISHAGNETVSTSGTSDLGLDFRKVTGRSQGPEANFTLSEEGLRRFAERVWFVQDFLRNLLEMGT
ncbi:hypothetical protein N7509_010648 [Penicillium cosmopolitanum]|uniref:Uncharacterized protein n=1 Tax=Penicillium cosmopolitanum TaxID=1131564 RepID=A0A9W9VRQ0_9EURO|nr:uncharacterized protein N7509_010648 [Penicillium cosmopolitanum]KAJ5388107.1 hypothetical protein N7509_010648 [Penicillium cosmopolitanum]